MSEPWEYTFPQLESFDRFRQERTIDCYQTHLVYKNKSGDITSIFFLIKNMQGDIPVELHMHNLESMLPAVTIHDLYSADLNLRLLHSYYTIESIRTSLYSHLKDRLCIRLESNLGEYLYLEILHANDEEQDAVLQGVGDYDYLEQHYSQIQWMPAVKWTEDLEEMFGVYAEFVNSLVDWVLTNEDEFLLNDSKYVRK